MLVNVMVKFGCDECGGRFEIRIDPAYQPPISWSVMEIAEDAIRGDAYCNASVEGSQHYCEKCTKVRAKHE